MIRLYNDQFVKKTTSSGKIRLYSDTQIKTFEEQNKPKIAPIQPAETPRVGIWDVIKGLPSAAAKIGGEVYNAIGGMAIPGATPEELRTPSLLWQTLNPYALGKATVQTAKEIIKPGGIDQAIIGLGRGVADSITGIIVNNFVKPEERANTSQEVANILDKAVNWTSAGKPVSPLQEGMKVGGSAAPIIAGGAAGKAIAGSVGAVAGFMGVGQASLPRESDIEARAVQAVKDLSILGLFALGSKAYNNAKGIIKNGIRESYKIKSEIPPEPPPPPGGTGAKIKLYPEGTGRPLSAEDIRVASESGMTVGEFKDVMERTSGIKTPGSKAETKLPTPERKPGMFITNVATDSTKTVEVQPLAQEATKYKSAEEFVKGNDLIFQGRKQGAGSSAFWTSNLEEAKRYAGENGKINVAKFSDMPEDIRLGLTKQEYISQKANQISAKEQPPIIGEFSSKSQLTDIWNKANQSKAVGEIKPPIEKPLTPKQQAIEARAQELGYKPTIEKTAGAVSERLTEELAQEYGYRPSEIPPAERITFKNETMKATDLIKSDPNKAYRTGMGIEKATDAERVATNIVLSEKALQEGDFSLYNRLMQNRSLAQLGRGQGIVLEKLSSGNSMSSMAKDLISTRLENLGKKYLKGIDQTISLKEKGAQIIKKEIENIKTETKKINIPKEELSWNNFLEKITC